MTASVGKLKHQRSSVRWKDDDAVPMKTKSLDRKDSQEKGNVGFNIDKLDLEKLKKEREENQKRRKEKIEECKRKEDKDQENSKNKEDKEEENYKNKEDKDEENSKNKEDKDEERFGHQSTKKSHQQHNKHLSDTDVRISRLVRANSMSRMFQTSYVKSTQEQKGPCYLKDLFLQFPIIRGVIYVINLSPRKQVFVRLSSNNWRSFTDQPAKWVGNTLDGNVDEFTFEFAVSMEFVGSIEFAICFKTPIEEYWDNNERRNYKIESLFADVCSSPQPSSYYLLPPSSPRTHN